MITTCLICREQTFENVLIDVFSVPHERRRKGVDGEVKTGTQDFANVGARD